MPGCKVYVGFLLIWCISHQFCPAQEFRPGFIIQQNGDTLRGLVAYRESEKAWKLCVFKPTKGTAPDVFDATEIGGYGFDSDRVFRSMIPPGQKSRVFIEILIVGNVSLYRSHMEYFAKKDLDSLRMLRIKKEIVTVDGLPKMRQVNEFTGLLNFYDEDCNEPLDVERIKLREKDLLKWADHYYSCTGLPFKVYKQNKPWLTIDFSLLGILSFAKPAFTAGAPTTLQQSDFTWSPSYGGSIGLGFTSPRVAEKLSFYTELGYWKDVLHGEYTIETPTIRYTDVYYDASYLLIPVGFRYRFKTSGLVPYIKGGYDFNIHLQSTAEQVEERVTSSMVTTLITDLNMRSGRLGFFGAAGLNTTSWKLPVFTEIRYRWAAKIFDELASPTVSSTLSRIEVAIGVNLFKYDSW